MQSAKSVICKHSSHHNKQLQQTPLQPWREMFPGCGKFGSEIRHKSPPHFNQLAIVRTVSHDKRRQQSTMTAVTTRPSTTKSTTPTTIRPSQQRVRQRLRQPYVQVNDCDNDTSKSTTIRPSPKKLTTEEDIANEPPLK